MDKIEFEKGRDILREKLNKQREIIMQTARSKDKAENALEELISLQKQIDVIPTLTVLEYGDAIDQLYENGCTVTLGTDFVHLHTNGYETIIKASNNATINIYKYYKRLFDLHNITNRSKEVEDEYQSLLLYCTLTFQFPVMWWGDAELLHTRFIENYEHYVKLLEYTLAVAGGTDQATLDILREQVLFSESLNPNKKYKPTFVDEQ